MTTQITVRLPEEVVEYIDSLVEAGEAKSRAAVVTRVLQHERRRLQARHDALIYATTSDPDLEGFGEWASQQAKTGLSDLD